MPDTALYCSWLNSSVCITQSEWAAWTQAILTVMTFAIALFVQRSTQKASERKQDRIRAAAEKKEDDIRAAAEKKEDDIRAAADRKEEELRADAEKREAAIAAQAREEKTKGDLLLAIAAAIPLRNRLLDTFTIGQFLKLEGSIASLSATFSNTDRLLDLRNFGSEAARLMDASNPVLRAVYAAEELWGYLEVRKDVDGVDPVSLAHIHTLAKALELQSVTAINALELILAPPVDEGK